MNDTQQRIGKLIEGEAERDAIHIAVYPAIAGERLWMGNRVKLRHGTSNVAIRDEYSDEIVGIVDPFLEGYSVEEGERFWIFLFPNTVTGMVHHWSHPAFDNPPARPENEHELWLRDFAERWNFDWDELIETAIRPNTKEEDDRGWAGRWVTSRGHDLHSAGELGADYELFWYHLEGFTGANFSPNHREGLSWSCTC